MFLCDNNKNQGGKNSKYTITTGEYVDQTTIKINKQFRWRITLYVDGLADFLYRVGGYNEEIEIQVCKTCVTFVVKDQKTETKATYEVKTTETKTNSKFTDNQDIIMTDRKDEEVKIEGKGENFTGKFALKNICALFKFFNQYTDKVKICVFAKEDPLLVKLLFQNDYGVAHFVVAALVE